MEVGISKTFKIQTPIRIVLSIVFITIFLATLFFSLITIADMQAMTGETGCPFSLVGGSVCPGGVSQHLSLWQDLSLATPLLLLLVVLNIRRFISVYSNIFRQFVQVWELIPIVFLSAQTVSILPPNYLKELFASGILHTKRF